MLRPTTSFPLAIAILAASAHFLSASINDDLALHLPILGSTLDASGHENHALMIGALLAPDRFGRLDQACAFDGAGDRLRVGDDPTLDLTGDLSIALWVNGDLFVGGFSAGDHDFAGYVDDVRVYARTLNANEVDLLHSLADPPGLEIRWASMSFFELAFQSVDGLQYQLKHSADRQVWSAVGLPINGDGNRVTYIDARPGPMHFWRIVIIE